MEQIPQQFIKPVPNSVQVAQQQKQFARGVILVILGIAILLHNMPATTYLMPDWLYGPHSLLMLLGLYNGIRHNFQNTAWLVLLLLGVYLMFEKFTFISHRELRYIGLPFAIILVGVYTILKRRR
ncbi:hypothetical protein [Taibaiella sp. KBW10]|uniref:LiaF transmembrane domain-containing protein n=1 Tax=Taibaiella sp. KBW10 TaxID=2153357 RepID=UPI000F5AC4AC|nr:hypothetical protein [Taibaiella sp. KBW10]